MSVSSIYCPAVMAAYSFMCSMWVGCLTLLCGLIARAKGFAGDVQYRNAVQIRWSWMNSLRQSEKRDGQKLRNHRAMALCGFGIRHGRCKALLQPQLAW